MPEAEQALCFDTMPDNKSLKPTPWVAGGAVTEVAYRGLSAVAMQRGGLTLCYAQSDMISRK